MNGRYCTWLVAALICCMPLSACKDHSSPFTEIEQEGTDPYCNALEVWDEEVDVSAIYSDSSKKDQIEVALEPRKEVVDVEAGVNIDGAEVSFIGYDQHALWLVLEPLLDVETIVIEGMASCRNKSAEFILTLTLDADSETIESHIEYPEGDPDGGVPDGGVPDGGDDM